MVSACGAEGAAVPTMETRRLRIQRGWRRARRFHFLFPGVLPFVLTEGAASPAGEQALPSRSLILFGRFSKSDHPGAHSPTPAGAERLRFGSSSLLAASTLASASLFLSLIHPRLSRRIH